VANHADRVLIPQWMRGQFQTCSILFLFNCWEKNKARTKVSPPFVRPCSLLKKEQVGSDADS
jgi:hypothetical protein